MCSNKYSNSFAYRLIFPAADCYRNIIKHAGAKVVLLVTVFLVCLKCNSFSQTFIVDQQGFIPDPAFKQLIIKRNYQLVSAFDTLRKTPLLLGAKAMVQGRWVVIDNHGGLVTQESLNLNHNFTSLSGSIGDVGIPHDDSRDKDLYKQININGKYGTVNKQTEKEGIPAKYDGLSFFSGGLVEIRTGDLLGLALSNGQIIKEPQYERIQSVTFDFRDKHNFYLEVVKGGKYGLLNSKGVEVISPEYDNLITDCMGCDIGRSLLLVSKNKKYGLFTKTGKLVLAPQYDQIRPLTFKGLTKVQLGSNTEAKFGVIDSTGKLLIPVIYNKISYETAGEVIRLTINEGGTTKNGLADQHGTVLIQPTVLEIAEFNKALAKVSKDGKYGLIDKSGHYILEPVYDRIDIDFYQPYIIATKDHLYGLFDMKGKNILPVSYDELQIAKGKAYVFLKNGQWGAGKLGVKGFVQLKYDKISISGNYLLVEQDHKVGMIDYAGKIIIPIKYDRFRHPENALRLGLADAVLGGIDYQIDRYGNELQRSR